MNQSTSANPSDPTKGLAVYQVGGSVRDELLGLPVVDRDYVVVGSDPKAMTARGFRSVGQDFPVFLHPITHEEYALARIERKKGHGYHGFEFDTGPQVSLEEDLGRRDLTINAMAIDADGQLIDPYNGRLDLARGVLRHVSDAFREDPVRVLRLARFATRFQSFSVADATLKLCHQMQASGELDYLVPERVWTEMSKALMHPQPSRFIAILEETHALQSVWPELHRQVSSKKMDTALMALDRLAESPDAPLGARFALLCQALDAPDIEASIQRLKPPKNCAYWAKWASTGLVEMEGLSTKSPPSVLAVIQSFDGIRQPDRLEMVSLLIEAWSGKSLASDSDLALIRCALLAIQDIDAAPLVAQGLTGPSMAEAMEEKRLECIAKCQAKSI